MYLVILLHNGTKKTIFRGQYICHREPATFEDIYFHMKLLGPFILIFTILVLSTSCNQRRSLENNIARIWTMVEITLLSTTTCECCMGVMRKLLSVQLDCVLPYMSCQSLDSDECHYYNHTWLLKIETLEIDTWVGDPIASIAGHKQNSCRFRNMRIISQIYQLPLYK